MITGIGIDIVETQRLAKKIVKEKGFREFVFSKSEIKYCESQTNKIESYAARFAAKEALLKAFGEGIFGKLILNEMEISNEQSGKPIFIFRGKTKKIISKRKISKILVSLSHLKSIACAVVVIEK